MGTDIVGYSRLVPVGDHVRPLHPALGCSEGHHLPTYTGAEFAASFRGIPIVGRGSFLTGGCYAPTPGTEEYEAWSGSSTAYVRWRTHLRDQFNARTDPDGPFYELIWFSDCEGTIGPGAALDLLADFTEHASDYRPPDDWHRAVFDGFTRACSLAADGGLIDFS